MKTQITIKNKETCITITVEHDEAMSISTELDAIEEQSKAVIEAGRSLIDEIRSLGNIEEELLDTSLEKLDSYTEKLDSYTENLDTSENSDEKPRCKWCGMTFEPRSKNEKYCSENCRHEARKDRDRIQKRLKYLNDPETIGGRKYDGKTCTRCGRFYIPTGPRQQFCKPDCKPLTPEEQTELDQVLAEVRQNQKSVKI